MRSAREILERMNFSDEWYLYSKLKMRGLAGNTFDSTEYAQRKERVREAIKTAKLSEQECWNFKGNAQTFAEAFHAVYEEEL